jgi:putative Holliday junction resolvase
MPLFNLAALLAAMPAGARLLGVDPGGRRIGLALSDVNRRLASPYGVLIRAKLKQNAAEIAAIAAKEGVGGLVIGMPLAEDQRLGPAAQAARDWAHAISAATGLPAAMQDESLTTYEAHEAMIGADISRARRRRLVDQVAAAAILQAALDSDDENVLF